ncbi:protein CURVATURE THYLAKOID 1C, chloroplastic [Argentina anserina]|uniref:protein CURVATURE THYLAKOID 1C, chloroplastic n=1 Tax=Argentina anserina TaxID=57926 RepID=UPI0021762889|nr:protein CURVATURE THYLAKOID 1C, chloroplastic [Potentilla anserina]
MASILASLPSPFLAHATSNTLLTALPKLPVCPIRERQNRVAVVVRATRESSESSSSLSIVESVQNAWGNSEDRIGLVGLGFAAVVGLWASANRVMAIDKVPLLPTVLEL